MGIKHLLTVLLLPATLGACASCYGERVAQVNNTDQYEIRCQGITATPEDCKAYAAKLGARICPSGRYNTGVIVKTGVLETSGWTMLNFMCVSQSSPAYYPPPPPPPSGFYPASPPPAYYPASPPPR
jgi:hypothetical protein